MYSSVIKLTEKKSWIYISKIPKAKVDSIKRLIKLTNLWQVLKEREKIEAERTKEIIKK